MSTQVPKAAVVYIPGMVARRADLDAMRRHVGGALGSVGVGFHVLPRFFGPASFGEPGRFVSRIRAAIRTWFAFNRECETIVLAGHSLGGLMARRAWLDALESEDQLDEWVRLVRGFVLVGSPDKGVDVSRLGFAQRALFRVLYGAGIFQHSLLSAGTMGSNFVTDLRLDWISRRRQGCPWIRIAHILGTEDGLIGRSDCLDLKQFDSPVVIDLPGADHDDLGRPKKFGDIPRFVGAWREAVAAVLREREGCAEARSFVVDGAAGTGKASVARAHAQNLKKGESAAIAPLPGLPPKRQTVVFLLHGIRASNHDWPKKLSAMIQARHPEWKVVVPSYGYFTALRFAIPWLRSRPVAWFKDQYTTLLDAHRDAVFHFVGHSNGTYAFGRAAAECRGVRFDRVCLVGSVLPPDYDLDALSANGRVGLVRVDCSARDLPVGLMCSLLAGLGMRDVGVGGVRGFQAAHAVGTTFKYHNGGHSRPLDDDHLPLIADFVDGKVVTPPALISEPSWLLGWPSRFVGHRVGACLVVLALLGGVLLPIYWFYGLVVMLVAVIVGLFVICLVADTF